VVHICFGYGAMVKGKPARYDCLSELAATTVQQAPSKRRSRRWIVRCSPTWAARPFCSGSDLSTSDVESPEVVADRIAAAAVRASRAG